MLFYLHSIFRSMTKNDKNTSDETEKALRFLIEKAQKENSALSKILKVLNNGLETATPEKGVKKPLNEK